MKKAKKLKGKRTMKRSKRRTAQLIPDTPENVAKALFGIRPDGKKIKNMKP